MTAILRVYKRPVALSLPTILYQQEDQITASGAPGYPSEPSGTTGGGGRRKRWRKTGRPITAKGAKRQGMMPSPSAIKPMNMTWLVISKRIWPYGTRTVRVNSARSDCPNRRLDSVGSLLHSAHRLECHGSGRQSVLVRPGPVQNNVAEKEFDS